MSSRIRKVWAGIKTFAHTQAFAHTILGVLIGFTLSFLFGAAMEAMELMLRVYLLILAGPTILLWAILTYLLHKGRL